MPLILMLTAGVITCIITYVQGYSVLAKLTSLLVVLLIFWFLGSVLKWTLDFFDAQNEEKQKEDGEVIEKEVEISQEEQEAHTKEAVSEEEG